jgi:tetratricopeptide (TPR) repeat protein
MRKETENKIWEHIEKDEYAQARQMLKNHLKRDNTNYWAMTMVAMSYYEERKYKKALEWSEKSLKECSDDPLTLWVYTGPLSQLGRLEEAIQIWQQIIEWGPEKVGLELCQEGIAWAKSLINNCRYMLAMAYKDKGNKTLALDYLQAHLAHRKGTKSIYPLKEVKKEMRELAMYGFSKK